ncbi:MAG: sensor histidine kinase [Anaerolineaceae bacterium]|nr:sensor histidine kinase [Anaerolineaceae bacterium]
MKRTFKRPQRVPRIRSFRFSITIFYIGMIFSISYMSQISHCIDTVNILENGSMAALFLIMMTLEWYESRKFQYNAPFPIAATFMFFRIILMEGIYALDCSEVTLFLYPIIPFNAYFTFGGNISIFVSLFYMMIALWRAGANDINWFTNADTTVNLVNLAFSLLFVQVMAFVVRRDERNRQHLDQVIADLEASHIKLHAYADQVAELAAAEERNRLARDIHDSLGHYLTAVNIQLEKALVYQDHDLGEAILAITEAKKAASDALRDVRKSVSTLRLEKEPFSLKSNLDELIKRLEDGEFHIDLHLEGNEDDYGRVVLMTLYRAAQEGLTNIQKHAKASQVTLNIHLGQDMADLTLTDNGLGFDTDKLNSIYALESKSFGLQGIQERLKVVRGNMTVRSEPEEGTELLVSVPRDPLAFEEKTRIKLSRKRRYG